MGKKQQAFALFEQGNSPSSPELKALKLKSQTRYNYYLEWQKGGGIIPSLSPPGEAIGVIDETKPVKKAPVHQSQERHHPTLFGQAYQAHSR